MKSLRLLLTFADPHQVRAISPYGLEIIRGHLAAVGAPADVVICNPFLEDLDPYRRYRHVLEEFDPDLVGFSMRNIDNAVMVLSSTTPADGSPFDVVPYVPGVRELVSVTRDWNPDVQILMGGSGFTSCPVECLRDFGVDFGLMGPAEFAVADLVAAMAAGGPPYASRVAEIVPTLPGAVYRQVAAERPDTRPSRLDRERADRFVSVSPQPRLADEPSYTPSIAPEYQLFAKLLELPVAVRTKTGCPLMCAYCIDPINMRRTYYRPIEHVLADIATYVDSYDLHKFHIADSEVNLPYEDRLVALCDGLEREGLSATAKWHGYFNITPCSTELVDALIRSNCYLPSFSVDSFDEQMLHAHHKNFRTRHVAETLDRMITGNDGTMTVHVGILFGAPGETRATMAYTAEQMRRYADEGVRIGYSCGLRVYPNTPLARHASLDPRHLYTHPTTPVVPATDGPAFPDQTFLLDTVVYYEPMPPRQMAGELASQFEGHPNISVIREGAVTESGLPDHVRLFNVGVYHLAQGHQQPAREHVQAAHARDPQFAPAAAALAMLPHIPREGRSA
ncbi:MAG: B12-binding domain-containing radical SAM protein [Nocardioidaceae bacterium]